MQAFEIYGPYGTRGYVRTSLTYTHTLLDSLYVVHELRLPTDPPPTEDGCPIPLHTSELPSGRNIVQESDGTWRNIFTDEYDSVTAEPILHSCPCVGYAIQEHPLPGKIKNPKDYLDQIRAANAHPSLMRELQLGNSVTLPDGSTLHGPPRRPGRKLVILGDTYDPSPIAELARDAHLLVHEATNSHLPALDSATKAEDTYESVEERTKSRGHSTPQMAGAFAKAIGAKRLVLNHFSSRYKADQDVVDGVDVDPSTLVASKIMMAIRDLAIDSYGSNNVTCARDFMSVDIEVPNEDDE
jgi:ribonuclease Z